MAFPGKQREEIQEELKECLIKGISMMFCRESYLRSRLLFLKSSGIMKTPARERETDLVSE